MHHAFLYIPLASLHNYDVFFDVSKWVLDHLAPTLWLCYEMSYQIRQNSGVAIAHCQTQSTVDLCKEKQKIQSYRLFQ